MMKMHGLKDAPYWLISYAYFLALSAAYMMIFIISGSIIGTTMLLNFLDSLRANMRANYAENSLGLAGLVIFRLNSYIIQCLFYFVCINLQIVLAFLLATFFSSVKTASG